MEEVYQKIKAGLAAIDVSSRCRLVFRGSDRMRYLNGQVTNNVLKLDPGDSLHAAVCTAKGKAKGDVRIARSEDALWLDADASLRESLSAWFERYIIADDVEMSDETDKWKQFHVLGENPSLEPGKEVLSFKSNRFGKQGTDFWIPAGESPKGTEIAPQQLTEVLRLEAALPAWGKEITEDSLPPEANFDLFGISYTKGCYQGQEVISRLKSIGGVKKRMCWMISDGLELPTSLPTPLVQEGREVGKLTSAAPSPAYEGKVLGLGIVKTEAIQTGNSFKTDNLSWTILELPYAEPSKH